MSLLRGDCLPLLTIYYAGSLPFVLGLLFFVAETSYAALSVRRHVLYSLGIACLFLWMRGCQSVFVVGMMARVAEAGTPAWSAGRLLRLLGLQAALQPFALFLVPLSALMVLPLPATLAFFHGVSIAGDGRRRMADVLRRAWSLASLWPLGNVALLGFFLILGLVLMVNIALGLLQGAFLLRSFAGVESPFTLDGTKLFHSTSLATLLGLTYLALDPVLRTTHVLRAFYGESRRSGADLLARLRRLTAPATMAVALLTLFPPPASGAGATLPGDDAPRLSPTDLDRSIREVLDRRPYRWRLPPPETVEQEERAARTFLKDSWDQVASAARSLRRGIWRMRHWLENLLGRDSGSTDLEGRSRRPQVWSFWVLLGAFAVLAGTLSVLSIHLVRGLRRRVVAAAPAAPSGADLRDESVSADQLPEEGWLGLAEEQLERGELRLALRALYLAGLASLASRQLIRLQRSKSNQDYEREVRRLARHLEPIPQAFARGVQAFDRVWYGMQPATPELLREFRGELDILRGDG